MKDGRAGEITEATTGDFITDLAEEREKIMPGQEKEVFLEREILISVAEIYR